MGMRNEGLHNERALGCCQPLAPPGRWRLVYASLGRLRHLAVVRLRHLPPQLYQYRLHCVAAGVGGLVWVGGIGWLA